MSMGVSVKLDWLRNDRNDDDDDDEGDIDKIDVGRQKDY